MGIVTLDHFQMILHGGSHEGPFLLAWNFEPFISLVLVGLTCTYYWAWLQVQQNSDRPMPSSYAWYFGAGMAILAFSLLGPLESYNEDLFTLHMAQHLVLLQIAAPLILLGRPVQVVLRAIPPRATKRTVRFLFANGKMRYAVLALTAPVTAFLLFNINIGFWHVPQFYDASVRNDLVHNLQHVMFAGTAMLYWWTIVDPVPRHHKLGELWSLASVFLSMMIGSIIGAILTLAQSVLYPVYLEAANPWGWDPLLDQQVGGLIMWVGSFVLYFVVLGVLAVKLMQRDEEETRSQAGQEQPAPSS